MADSFNKKDREKKKQKKRKEKAERKVQRKVDGVKPAEFMYLDEDGNLTATPPDPTVKKVEYSLEDISISTPKKDESDDNGESKFMRLGTVKFFNTEKGYGFIVDKDTRESYFVHADSLSQEIREHDRVSFEIGKGPKGPVANAVKLLK